MLASESSQVIHSATAPSGAENLRPTAGVQAPEVKGVSLLGILRNTYAGIRTEGTLSAGEIKTKKVFSEEEKTRRQITRFELQRAAARLTPNLRVAHCLWTQCGQAVEVLKRGGDARLSGVQTCGSVWMCPICSARIAETRRQELKLLEEWSGSPKRGFRLVLMTLTARHRKRKLSDLVDRMARSKTRLQNRKRWQHLRESGILFGTVSVREATYGLKNGWHPHYHVLCLVRADDDDEALLLLEPFRATWLDCLRKEGLTGTAERAFDIRPGDAVSAYISKHGRDEDDRKAASEARSGWGIAEEMTQARTKVGRGDDDEKSRSPWQILRDAHAGDETAEKLWQEYALTMLGRRQQVWSNGLKATIGLIEIEDEKAAEGEEYTEDQDEICWRFDRDEWRQWRHLRGQILAAARAGGEVAVAELLAKPAQEPEHRLIEPAPHDLSKPLHSSEGNNSVRQIGNLAAIALALVRPPDLARSSLKTRSQMPPRREEPRQPETGVGS